MKFLTSFLLLQGKGLSKAGDTKTEAKILQEILLCLPSVRVSFCTLWHSPLAMHQLQKALFSKYPVLGIVFWKCLSASVL